MLSFGHLSLMISVDADDNPVSEKLLELFSQHGVNATWSVTRPAQSKLATRILAQHPNSEVALLGDASWVSEDRTKFARELQQRIGGLSVQTLALRGVGDTDHHTVLAKHQISMIRPCSHSNSEKSVRPSSARFGIWKAPKPVELQRLGGWLPNRLALILKLLAAKRQLKTLHVSLDTNQVRPKELVNVDTFLAAVANWQDRIQIQTLADLNRQLRPVQNAPSRSVLRAA